ncbi:BrnT family toxin [Archaeoglobus sp. UBA230]|jgi:uncharacterized DUF497 family protein|uniref:BrnT family toxin n=1 Tax=Archaeoglobus sp. UBA230 TaxID=1915565 RepID=UPI0025C55DF1|nr:BrnT family toxin [Archaeoglobus sp. UBA230]
MVKKYSLIWDEWNLNHIAKHGVSKREVEEAVNDERAYIKKHRKRVMVVGSAWGRILVVILEKIERNDYYVISARDATNSEKRLYRKRGKGL